MTRPKKEAMQTFRFKLSTLLVILSLIGCEKNAAPEPVTTLDERIANKMTQYAIPGLALAIVKDEKLVYLKSYGLADKESNEPASNDNLWRIASLSKPITAIAILKLAEDGLITLDQKVFSSNGILGNDYGSPPASSAKDLITVRHLLDHKSGWTNSPDDPMFSHVGDTQSQLIADLLANRPLTYSPGSTYYYLNFGYCILGRVIEKVTGMTYPDYVKSLIAPMGITEMNIAGNTLQDRRPEEVKYYQSEYSPYSMDVTRMDSHGGWIASSKDLAKFMVRIDRRNSVQDITSHTMLNQFYFGYPTWVHYGSLPGTSAILSRLNDTFSFVVLANTRTEGDVNIILDDLNNTVSGQINAQSTWPTGDSLD
jgi:CubicO group peptidase (beta-lactamase class C family)